MLLNIGEHFLIQTNSVRGSPSVRVIRAMRWDYIKLDVAFIARGGSLFYTLKCLCISFSETLKACYLKREKSYLIKNKTSAANVWFRLLLLLFWCHVRVFQHRNAIRCLEIFFYIISHTHSNSRNSLRYLLVRCRNGMGTKACKQWIKTT